MDEVRPDALSVGLDRAIKLEFHGAHVSSDAGLFLYPYLDEAVQLPKRPDKASRPPSWCRTRPVASGPLSPSIPVSNKRLELGFPAGRVTLVPGKLGGGAGRRSNGKCRLNMEPDESPTTPL